MGITGLIDPVRTSRGVEAYKPVEVDAIVFTVCVTND